MEIPDVTQMKMSDGILLECDSIDCNWSQLIRTHNQSAAEHFIDMHQKWHVEGCPE